MNAQNELEYTVGVSVNQEELHTIMAELQQLNFDRNTEVEQRFRELVLSDKLDAKKTKAAEEADARSDAMIQTMSILSHELGTPLQVCRRQCRPEPSNVSPRTAKSAHFTFCPRRVSWVLPRWRYWSTSRTYPRAPKLTRRCTKTTAPSKLPRNCF